MESDPLGVQPSPNTYSYALATPLLLTDPKGLDPYPNCPRTPDGALCRAGIGSSGSANGGAASGAGVNVSLNVQLARIGVVPVGVSLACNVGPNGLSGVYFGAGIVGNTAGAFSSFSPRASVNSQHGNPSGWGARLSGTAGFAAAGLGGSASLFSNCLMCKGAGDGWASNFGIGPSSGPSYSFTFGYRGR